MNMLKACIKVTHFKGEKYISIIYESDECWLIASCDQSGYINFNAPILISKETEQLSYANIIDLDTNDFIERYIPAEFLSNKDMMILSVIKNLGLSNTLKKHLDSLYEKYDLYNKEPVVTFSILNYYANKISKLDNELAYKAILDESRSLEELIEASSSFKGTIN